MKNPLFLGFMFLISSLKEYGRKRANPHACIKNNLKLTEGMCCGENDSPVCKETLTGTIDPAEFFMGITFEGKQYSVTNPVISEGGEEILGVQGPIPLTDKVKIEEFIGAVLTVWEVCPYCTCKIEGTTITVEHIGACELTLLHFSDSDDVARTERCCDLATINKFQFTIKDDAADLEWDGNSEALANSPYEFQDNPTADQATADQLKTDVEAALTALGVQYNSVEVTIDDIAGEYVVAYHTREAEGIMMGFKQASFCGGEEGFVCP